MVKDHAARGDRQFLAQVGAALCLRRRLSEQVLAAREGAEELVVEVVAVGEDDDGRVLHRRLARDGARVEGHRQALARALRVPDDADAAVAGRATGLLARLVAAGLLTDAHIGAQPGCPQRLGDGGAHGVELVVAGHLLREHPAAVVLEDDEVAEQRQQPLRRADALKEHAQFQRGHLGEALARDRAPRLEPLLPRGEGPEARLGAVRDHQQLVHREQRGQLGLVGLELLPRRPDVGLLVGRILELDHAEGQAVDEQHDVGTAGVVALGDGHLVDREEVVGGGVGVVDDGGLVAADRASGGPVLDVHALDEHAVEGAVASLEGRALGPGQLAVGRRRALRRAGPG